MRVFIKSILLKIGNFFKKESPINQSMATKGYRGNLENVSNSTTEFELKREIYKKETKINELNDQISKKDKEILRLKNEQSIKIDKNKERGELFEQYVVSRKFSDRKRFRFLEWRGDKIAHTGENKIYPESNTYPDLLYQCIDSGQKFAVECKNRSRWYTNAKNSEGVDWIFGDSNRYKIKKYNDYSKENKLPVFIVIGIGEDPYKPDSLFSVPLDRLDDIFISKKDLEKYRKDINKNFVVEKFYDKIYLNDSDK